MERFGSSLVLLDKLAAGGMAEVYRAKQLGHGGFEKVVAVKRILPQYAESEDFKEMFLQEASLSAHLQHPNVIQTYSNGEVGGYLYLTMEFVDGKNLRQILAKIDRQKKRLPMEYALFVIAEAAKGLHYAHDFEDERSGQPMNIVHRDMSPQNIMLGYDGTVKIVDFGIAKMAAQAESTRAGVLKGKFGYMSPEQARGMPLDRRTDIFALGIILFEVLTQRRLFASDDDMRTLRLVKECRIPRVSKYNPSIGPKLDQIVLKSLAKEKSERYETALDLYEDLQRLLQELFPKFIPSDFSKYLRETFSDEIREEKQKREKLHREAPAILDNSRYEERAAKDNARKESAQPSAEGGNGNVTMVEEDQATQISNALGANKDLAVPALGESVASGHQDGSLSQAAISHLQFNSPSLGLSNISDAGPLVLGGDLPPSSAAPFEMVQKTATGLGGVSRPLYSNEMHASSGSRKSRSSAKTRRLAYVSLILIGIVVYLGTDEQKNKPSATVAHQEVKHEASASQAEAPKASTEVAASAPQAAPDLSSSAPVESATPIVKDSPMTEMANASTEPSSSGPSPASISEAPASNNIDENVGSPSAMENHSANDSSDGALSGYLSLTCYPRADTITIDGKLMRDKNGNPLTSPVSNLALPPGQYKVLLHNTTYNVSWSGEVQIRSQKISPLNDVVLK